MTIKPNGTNGTTSDSDEASDDASRLVPSMDSINAALAGQNARLVKSLQKAMGEVMAQTMAQAMAPLIEKMGSIQAPPAAPNGEGQPDVSAELKTQLAQLNKRLEQSETARAEEKRAREQERATRLRQEENTHLFEGLRGAGVIDDVFVNAAGALLRDKIVRNEEGAIVFRKNDLEAVPLKDGLKEWAKSDEGKRFLPARQAAGSGAGPARGAPTGQQSNGLMPQGDAIAALNQALSGGGLPPTE